MQKKFPPPRELQKTAQIKSMRQYKQLYKRALENPNSFWADMASELTWYKPWKSVMNCDFSSAKIRWFEGGKLNASVNCLDRHILTWKKNKAAIIWIGDEPGQKRVLTYQQLHDQVSRFANVLKAKGVRKGDRVAIFLPMIPELPIAMLACARIGAVHSVIFGGFSAESLANRIQDCRASILITADHGRRGGKLVPLKDAADRALASCPEVNTCIVVRHTGMEINMHKTRDCWWHEELKKVKRDTKPASCDAEHPLFILYTSGSTGKPKGVVHTTGGYLLYTYLTFKWIFDIKDDDTYWCTADIGWITGHSYMVYGPLAAGASVVMFEGVPTYPNPGRFWQIVEENNITILYTAPTAIRALARYGTDWLRKYDLSTLRILGSVGEVINPEAWKWYYKYVGRGKCPIVDTWWQTETGGIVLSSFPAATPTKPGSAGVPFPGITPLIVNDDGKRCKVNESGYLLLKTPWPGMARTIFNDHERFKQTYFTQFTGYYFTGDGAKKDKDGFYWLMGRVDDVINVSGHRLGTAEIESALVSHNSVAEAAVVGYPHEIKGEGIYAFVILNSGVQKGDELKNELIRHVRKEIGPIASPDKIQFVDSLPKTRSGKIMRRILRKVAAGDVEDLGDLTTLADAQSVDQLIKDRLQQKSNT